MVKKQKLLQKAYSGSKNFRFSDFVRLIESFGFALERITGSHHIFSNPDVPQSITAQPDKNGQAKPYQLKQFLRLIEKYDLYLTSDEEESDRDLRDSDL